MDGITIAISEIGPVESGAPTSTPGDVRLLGCLFQVTDPVHIPFQCPGASSYFAFGMI